MGSDGGAEQSDDIARLEKRLLEPEIQRFIQENSSCLSTEAIGILQGMPPSEQRRVLVGGPLRTKDDPIQVIRTRAEQECPGQLSGKHDEMLQAGTSGANAAKPEGAVIAYDADGVLQISQLVRKATEEEVQLFLHVNRSFMDQTAVEEFMAMNGKDQKRVIDEGDLFECKDAASVLMARVKKAKELESKLEAMIRNRGKAKKKPPKEKTPPPTAEEARKNQDSFIQAAASLAEVPVNQRRCLPVAKDTPEPEEKPVLVGTVKGVGGVVEILKQKYNCKRGDRLRVVGDAGGPAGIWKLESEKSVPKTQLNQGWKWVLGTSEPQKEPKPKAAAQTSDKVEDRETGGRNGSQVENKNRSKSKAGSPSRSRSSNRRGMAEKCRKAKQCASSRSPSSSSSSSRSPRRGRAGKRRRSSSASRRQSESRGQGQEMNSRRRMDKVGSKSRRAGRRRPSRTRSSSRRSSRSMRRHRR